MSQLVPKETQDGRSEGKMVFYFHCIIHTDNMFILAIFSLGTVVNLSAA